MNIPEEAIEAAAQAMFAEEQCDRLQKLHVEENWQGRLNGGDRNEYRAFARAALEAAAPFIAAQALRDTADAWSDWDALSAPEDWLRTRAADLESPDA